MNNFLLKFAKSFNSNSERCKKMVREFSQEGFVNFFLAFLSGERSFLYCVKYYDILNHIFLDYSIILYDFNKIIIRSIFV